jgi:hypothetical protein
LKTTSSLSKFSSEELKLLLEAAKESLGQSDFTVSDLTDD